ncbi:MAG: hypothetical protein C0399_06125 [Syntrophus sp. (in: bacteria)]|nr:hypothetical protein [Syntrophus sp. (in: bacteria)]
MTLLRVKKISRRMLDIFMYRSYNLISSMGVKIMYRISIGILLLFLLIPGCAEYAWYNPNKGQAGFDQDNYRCLQETSKLYPPQFATRQLTSGYQAPSTTNCYDYGGHIQCQTTPGYHSPPVTTIEDANQTNRQNAFNACMHASGWSLQRVDK